MRFPKALFPKFYKNFIKVLERLWYLKVFDNLVINQFMGICFDFPDRK